MLLAQAHEEQYCIQLCASITASLRYKYKEKQVGKHSMCKYRFLGKKNANQQGTLNINF